MTGNEDTGLLQRFLASRRSLKSPLRRLLTAALQRAPPVLSCGRSGEILDVAPTLRWDSIFGRVSLTHWLSSRRHIHPLSQMFTCDWYPGPSLSLTLIVLWLWGFCRSTVCVARLLRTHACGRRGACHQSQWVSSFCGASVSCALVILPVLLKLCSFCP